MVAFSNLPGPDVTGVASRFNPEAHNAYWKQLDALNRVTGLRFDASGNPLISIDGVERPWLNYAGGSGIIDLGGNKGLYLDWQPSGGGEAIIPEGANADEINQLFLPHSEHTINPSDISLDNVRSARNIDDLSAWMSSGQDDWLDKLMTIAGPAAILGPVALAETGITGPSDLGGLFGSTPTGGGVGATGGGTAEGALPWFDAGAGGFIDPTTGLMMDTQEALATIGSSGNIGADTIASLTNYANSASPASLETIASSILPGVSNAGQLLKTAATNGTLGDLLKFGGQMIGQNIADKSIGRDINDMFDRLEGMSVLGGRKDELADLAMKRFGTDYLTPERQEQLWGDYSSRPYQDLISTASTGLQDLFTNPMANPIMQAASNITAENAARRSAAGRGLNAGSMPAEMQDALLTSLGQMYGNIANPMTSAFQAGTGAQTQARSLSPQMWNALTNANQAAWAGGTAAANAGNAPLNAAANLAPLALQAKMFMDPTRSNLASIGSGYGNVAAGGNGNLATKAVDFLSGLF